MYVSISLQVTHGECCCHNPLTYWWQGLPTTCTITLNWFQPAIGGSTHVRNRQRFHGMNLWFEHEMQITNRPDSRKLAPGIKWSWPNNCVGAPDTRFVNKSTDSHVHTPPLTISIFLLLPFMVQYVQSYSPWAPTLLPPILPHIQLIFLSLMEEN